MSARDPAVGHTPVLLREVLAMLAPRAGATYVDATFGAGGYARAILDAAACRVYGVDRDPAAVADAADMVRLFGDRLHVLHGRFAEMERLLSAAGVDRIDGVGFDLGMSSTQVDAAERGFSFRFDGPLDMRMDRDENGPSAADVVNGLPEDLLAGIFRDYGEERASRRIARAIVRARARQAITRTAQLSDVIRGVLPPEVGGIDPATRTFQALRVFVNDELRELECGLTAAERLLVPGGRLCVVAYHSLEDRAVKSFLRLRSGGEPRPSRHAPFLQGGDKVEPSFRLLQRGAVRPAPAEVASNPRARSARLRAAERTAAPPWPGSTSQRRAA